MNFDFLKNIKIGKPSVKGMIFWGVTIVLAIVVFVVVSNFTQCWTFTKLPGIAPAKCGVTSGEGGFTVNEEGTPIANELPPDPLVIPESNLPAPWDGASRINILFIGLDERDLDENQGPPRTDSMPPSKTHGCP